MSGGAAQIEIREVSKENRDAIPDFDDSFTTDSVLDVHNVQDGLGFIAKERKLLTPLQKTFPVEEEGDDNENSSNSVEHTFVASPVGVETIAGYIRTEYLVWNKRLVIRNISIAPTFRRQGLGQVLVEEALEHGKQQYGAKQAWLEVSNINVPAFKAYTKYGFELCGMDLSLYKNTPAAGEIALFMSRPL